MNRAPIAVTTATKSAGGSIRWAMRRKWRPKSSRPLFSVMRRSSEAVNKNPVMVRKMSIPPETRPLANRWKPTTSARAIPRTPCNSGRNVLVRPTAPTCVPSKLGLRPYARLVPYARRPESKARARVLSTCQKVSQHAGANFQRRHRDPLGDPVKHGGKIHVPRQLERSETVTGNSQTGQGLVIGAAGQSIGQNVRVWVFARQGLDHHVDEVPA